MNEQQLKIRAWRFGITMAGVLIALFAVLVLKELSSIGHVGDQAPVNTITVTGTGNVTVIPNVATFSFTVTETAVDVATAQKSAADKTNAAISELEKDGVAQADIQTTSYDITPHYDYGTTICPAYSNCPQSNPTLTGYDVSQSISVKVRDITKAGTLFAVVGSSGVQNVNDLSFSVDNLDAVKDQARDAAITDARSQANKLASELGVSIVRVTNFSDNSSAYPYPIMAAMSSNASGAAASVPQVPAGQQKITDSVSVTYEIR